MIVESITDQEQEHCRVEDASPPERCRHYCVQHVATVHLPRNSETSRVTHTDVAMLYTCDTTRSNLRPSRTPCRKISVHCHLTGHEVTAIDARLLDRAPTGALSKNIHTHTATDLQVKNAHFLFFNKFGRPNKRVDLNLAYFLQLISSKDQTSTSPSTKRWSKVTSNKEKNTEGRMS